MKTLIFTMFLVLGFSGLSFAGNHPALTYPAGHFANAEEAAQMTHPSLWAKNVLHYPSGVSGMGVWYSYCPAAGLNHQITVKSQDEVKLSNGKRIMLCCKTCKDDVEKDLTKFKAFMY